MESLGYVLEVDILSVPTRIRANQEDVETHGKWVKYDVRVRGFMMGSMTNELQRAHETMTSARQILARVTELCGERSRTAIYEISKQLFGARMNEGEKVGDHVLKMIFMIERLEALNFRMLLMNKLSTAQSQMKISRVKEAALVISSGPRRSNNKKKKNKKQLKPQAVVRKEKGKALMVLKASKAKPMDRCLKCCVLRH
ncbi:hypothetical protein OROHE_006219 [Orobanche hederae]